MRLDEILEALPSVGLRLWMLDQPDADHWSMALYDPSHPLERFCGTGTSPLAAAVAACDEAGVSVRDE
jgi:hypothetical protein